jgi:CRP-like cAMP-binding protein
MTVERLMGSSIFQGLAPAALERIYEQGTIIKANSRAIIIHEGQTNRHMYIVLSGELKIKLARNPSRFTGVKIAVRGPGECVGEYSFIDQEPAGVTVEVSQATELFKISHTSLSSLLKHDPELERILYRNLLFSLVNRLRASDAQLDLVRPL